jgi:uncharacterized protein YdaU (DUF1376 family)
MSTYDVSFVKDNSICNSNRNQRREAKEIIENDLPFSIDGSIRRKTLVKKIRVRLDLQETYSRNGKQYANLQIQLNARTAFDGLTDESEEEEEDVVTDGGGGKNRSTTIAIVLMPCDEEIPQNKMKDAFNGSLKDGTKATIFKTP